MIGHTIPVRNLKYQSQFVRFQKQQLLKRNSIKCSDRLTNLVNNYSLQEEIEQTLQQYPPPQHIQTQYTLKNYKEVFTQDWLAGYLHSRGSFVVQSNFECPRSKRLDEVWMMFSMVVPENQLYIVVALDELFGRVGKFSRLKPGANWKYLVKRSAIYPNITPIFDQVNFQRSRRQEYAFYRELAKFYSRKRKFREHLHSYIFSMLVLDNQMYKNKNRKSNAASKASREKNLQQSYKLLQTRLQNYNFDKNELEKWRYQIVKISSKSTQLADDFVVGMVDAGKSFYIQLEKMESESHEPHVDLKPLFRIIYQDASLLQQIQLFFNNCGKVQTINVGIRSGGRSKLSYYIVSNIFDIVEVIIPFFLKNPLLSPQYNDFIQFATVSYQLYWIAQIKIRLYLTKEILRQEKIYIPYAGMLSLILDLVKV
eukprot:TRINITY_DN15808_c0_g1_i3.p1 TRINITY_DN15808_c0_g1~~TRINITY_DN15808_c0_g1_i3.p1  ORF type:complete len:441 (-),score=6.62 TRINITY_DN15808_c0_g1_i3:332-1606(-)